jgi:hypothetical protein
MIQVPAVRKDHFSDQAPVPIHIPDPNSNRLSEGQVARKLPGPVPERLPPLRAVDAVKPHPDLPLVVRDRDRDSVLDADHATGDLPVFRFGSLCQTGTGQCRNDRE